MTNQEAREKSPNVAKLADFINQQDKQTQLAAMFLLAAMAAMNEGAAE